MENIEKGSEMKDYISKYYFHNIVEENNETISLLDFTQFLNSFLSPLFDINANSYSYAYVLNKNKVNGMYSDINVETKEKFNYLKRFSFDDISLNTAALLSNCATSIDLYLHRSIRFHKHYYTVTVESDKENGVDVTSYQPYYTSNKDSLDKCVSYSNEFLAHLISFINEYRPFLDKIKKNLDYNIDIFDIRFVMGMKKIIPNITIKESIIKAYDEDQTEIRKFVYDNEDLILCNIPINIKELPIELQSYIYQKRNERTFIEELRGTDKILKRTKNNK